ncbi:MAG: CheR family methyltransferase [Oleiphilaceae bacterium]|nr:CheR family methyltransferase [Oleiphilaceae bacterium]
MSTSTQDRAERQREFLYQKEDFQRVKKLIYDRAGIHLRDNKMEMVYSRLSRRLRALKLNSIKVYLDQLEAASEGEEWQSFINALTTNLTSFFREAHHFERLAEHVRQRGPEPLRVWCCAASTGEEPYTIAMTLLDALGPDFPFEVIATDVDTDALATARAGVYGMDRVKGLSPELLKRHFLKGKGRNAGKVRIKPVLARRVSFHPTNLLDSRWQVEDSVDVIFCRNVFIYFDTQTQGRILQRFHRLLVPEGLLFAGHSESLMGASNLFRSLGKTVFRPLH